MDRREHENRSDRPLPPGAQQGYNSDTEFVKAAISQKLSNTRLGGPFVEPDRQTTAREEIISRINEATSRICQQTIKLDEIGTRIMGPLPENDDGTAGLERNADGMLDRTFQHLTWLDKAIGRLEAATLRLERI